MNRLDFPDRETVEQLRKEYPRGCRIVLDHMDDAQAPPVGTQGVCTGVDDAGSICCHWDTGSSLSVAWGADYAHKIRTEDEAKATLLRYAAAQHDGARCPRCGEVMPGKLYRHALSRRLDIIVCDSCGQREALEDAGIIKKKMPLMEWAAIKEPQEGGGRWPQ